MHKQTICLVKETSPYISYRMDVYLCQDIVSGPKSYTTIHGVGRMPKGKPPRNESVLVAGYRQ